MTIKSIVKEIEKRIEQLNVKYDECYHKLIQCRVYGDSAGMDKWQNEMQKASCERCILQDMLHESKHYKS